MSVVVINNQVVHYEVFGRGRPVLFLHGWLGSWRYWFDTMEVVSNHFRTYSFDFWGFGDSPNEAFQESVRSYSAQVMRFLDELGIDQVMLVGHSMGGMVAMQTALDHPQRVQRVVTVGAPFDGRSLSWLLKLTSIKGMADIFARSPWLRRNVFRFFMGKTNDPAVREIIDETVKSDALTLRSTVASMLSTDLRPDLPALALPALVIHGGRDEVVNPNQVSLFGEVPMAQPMLMPRSRHFPFFDEPAIFHDQLLHFLRKDLFYRLPRLKTPYPEHVV